MTQPSRKTKGDVYAYKPSERAPKKQDIPSEKLEQTHWLTPQNSSFFRKNGLLWLNDSGKECRVSLRRNFPFEKLWEYISVLDEQETEVGMIRDVAEFTGDRETLLREELERRYYAPVILQILSLKERFGFSYWKVETEQGKMEFTLKDTYKSLIRLDGKRIFVLDVDGNRFVIPDVSALDRKSYRKIELYL